jgi:hypothetical protein
MTDSLIDTTINEYVEQNSLSEFGSSIRYANDYWYIWVKSGVLDYVCAKLKAKYQIPILSYSKDYISTDTPVGPDDSVQIDHHIFYDKWRYKARFRKELEGYINELRLPRLAFNPLFDHIFYNHRLKVQEKWRGMDTNSVFKPLDIADGRQYGQNSYTKSEAKVIKEHIHSALMRRGVILMEDELDKRLRKHLKELTRKTRTVQNKKLYVAVIQQMKVYKKVDMWNDYTDDKESPDKKRGRQIAEKCAARIAAKLSLDDFTSVAFRRMVARLYADFPILKDYITSSISTKS